MLKIVIALVSIALLTGAFGGKIKKIDLEMSRAAVIEILGRPDGVRTYEDYVALEYTDKLISGFSWNRADYVVLLKADKVIQYGTGDIQTQNPNTGAFIFVPIN